MSTSHLLCKISLSFCWSDIYIYIYIYIYVHTHTHTHTHDLAHCSLLKVKVNIAQLCSTFCNPMDFTLHEILQARILEWVAFPCSRVIILVHSIIDMNFDHFPFNFSTGKPYFPFLTSYLIICVHILFLIKYLLTSFRILWRNPAPLPIHNPTLILSEDMCTHKHDYKFLCNF